MSLRGLLLPIVVGLLLLMLIVAMRKRQPEESSPQSVDLHAVQNPPVEPVGVPRGRICILRLEMTGLSAQEGFRVTVDDVLGVPVLNQQLSIDQGRGTVRLLPMPPGKYYVRVMTSQGALLREYAFRVLH
jgi:hypothetical protein